MSAEPPRQVLPGDVLLAIHNFDARGEDELSFRRGDKIELIELDDGFGDGWYLGKHVNGDTSGLFPGVYTTQPPRLKAQPNEGSSTSNVPPKSESPVFTTDEMDRRLNSSPSDDVTPQASRQSSTSDAKLPPDSPSETNSNQPDRSRPVNSSPGAPVPRGVQRTISETIGSNMNGEDSPVLNETLSVIDEHITDFNTPRHSVVAHEQRSSNDSSSEYSSHVSHRLSYIPGAETDDEEENTPSEAEVRRWDAKKTAGHLRELGVDSKHCDIFEQEEITGDVLLEMDQEFLYMKDFDFGPMGRRLKTWHKVKGFQEEIRGPTSAGVSASNSVSPQPRRIASDEFDRSQSRAGGVAFLPRIPSVNDGQNGRRSNRDTATTVDTTGSPHSPSTTVPMGRNTSSRPSADSIRQSNYRKRHSSIDTTYTSQRQDTGTRKPPTNGVSRGKQSSFDRGWTMTSGAANLPRRPGTALGTSEDQNQSSSWHNDSVNGPSTTSVPEDSIDADKGYFSGGEVDNRRSRNMLRKRDSAARSFSHSRHSSATADPSAMSRLRSRFGLTDSLGDVPPQSKRRSENRTRSRTTGPIEMAEDESHSPTVTNLEENSKPTNKPLPSRRQNSKQNGDTGSNKNSPTSNFKNVAPIVRRAMGLRAISDAVTRQDKAMISSPTSASPAKDSPASPARTDSSTPSGASKSFEVDSTDSSLKGAEGHKHLTHKGKSLSNRNRPKNHTSAYTRGLEHKPPQEQIVGCDYYGWMKKKSSHLMTTWKPRLFVLRGRRLSYYYSEDDTEERGLIDISSHRVFRADHDTITSLHATLTGAKGTPTSPHHIGASDFSPTNGESPVGNRSQANTHSADGSFIFKLVPPKVGSARAVQFTKPAVHFFQVDNIQQGRLWMAALMKATIERDLNLPVKSSNKQKTISLKQAVTMNQMPPSLKDTEREKDSSEQDGKPNNPDQSEADTQNSNTEESVASDSVQNLLRLSKLDDFDAGSIGLFSETPARTDNNT